MAYAIIVYFMVMAIISALVTVSKVGKPAKPVTHGQAVGVTAWAIFHLVLLAILSTYV